MFGPNTPGTLVVLAGAILLLLSTLSTPIRNGIYFFSANVNLTVSGLLLNGNIKLGVFGYCIILGTQEACISPRLGYELKPASLLNLPDFDLGVPDALLRALTYLLILHPIAAGLAALATISGLISHFREYSRSCFTSCLASLAATVALLAFLVDIIAFSIAKSRINSASIDNATTNAHLGNAIWITLAGWACLVLSGIFFCTGRCLIRNKRRNQIQTAAMRPPADSSYEDQMRREAIDAEKARDAAKEAPHVHSSLPSFAEYSSQEASHPERIPLNRFEGLDDEHYSDRHHNEHHTAAHHTSSSSPDRRLTERALEGVGIGYGAHPPVQPRAQSSINVQESVYSHPSFLHTELSHHSSQSRGADQPNTIQDIHSNLPAHITPASDRMTNSPIGLHTDKVSPHLPAEDDFYRSTPQLGFQQPAHGLPLGPPFIPSDIQRQNTLSPQPMSAYSNTTSPVPEVVMFGRPDPQRSNTLGSDHYGTRLWQATHAQNLSPNPTFHHEQYIDPVPHEQPGVSYIPASLQPGHSFSVVDSQQPYMTGAYPASHPASLHRQYSQGSPSMGGVGYQQQELYPTPQPYLVGGGSAGGEQTYYHEPQPVQNLQQPVPVRATTTNDISMYAGVQSYHESQFQQQDLGAQAGKEGPAGHSSLQSDRTPPPTYGCNK